MHKKVIAIIRLTVIATQDAMIARKNDDIVHGLGASFLMLIKMGPAGV
jgi:hypothetical protein